MKFCVSMNVRKSCFTSCRKPNPKLGSQIRSVCQWIISLFIDLVHTSVSQPHETTGEKEIFPYFYFFGIPTKRNAKETEKCEASQHGSHWIAGFTQELLVRILVNGRNKDLLRIILFLFRANARDPWAIRSGVNKGLSNSEQASRQVLFTHWCKML